MISISRKQDCCGCNVCGDVCPKGAISFEPDEEGFLYPIVDKSKCIKCGLCDKVCPQLQAARLKETLVGKKPECFAAVTKSIPDRFDSTSGGVYTTLADYILSQGGYVGGAVWNEGFSISQIISSSRDDLPRLRSSKYAQSDAQGFYKAVKDAVSTKKLVLVCGTPCQMAAIKLFVGEADNLYLVDFICRGVNSQLALAKYIEQFEQWHGKKVIAIKQKCKELGWRKLTTKFIFEDGSIAYDPVNESLFMKGYLIGNVLCRPSCYECQYKTVSHITDLTIADCWGAVSKLPKEMDGDLGTSTVLCHTNKGYSIFKLIEDKLTVCSLDIQEVVKGSSTILQSLDKPICDRGEFYKKLKQSSFEDAMRSILPRDAPLSFFDKVKHVLSPFWRCRGNLVALFRCNGWKRLFKGMPYILPVGKVIWLYHRPTSKIIVNKRICVGDTIFRGSSLDTRFYISPYSTLILNGGTISYGANIQIFNGGILEIGENFFSNIGATIICGGHIKMGKGVTFGRNVTVRDYHGNHMLNTPGYQHTKPVTIGDHVWLCEWSTIMPGVTVGSGSVIAAHALVTKDVPPNSLVAGVPAKVIRTGVQWKL